MRKVRYLLCIGCSILSLQVSARDSGAEREEVRVSRRLPSLAHHFTEDQVRTVRRAVIETIDTLTLADVYAALTGGTSKVPEDWVSEKIVTQMAECAHALEDPEVRKKISKLRNNYIALEDAKNSKKKKNKKERAAHIHLLKEQIAALEEEVGVWEFLTNKGRLEKIKLTPASITHDYPESLSVKMELVSKDPIPSGVLSAVMGNLEYLVGIPA